MLRLEMDRRTTAEQAADAIRNEILSGSIKDGDEIIQEQVAANLGLSRMPVREALRQLESEGLIERMDNRRTRAIGVTGETLKTRFELLCALTKLAVKGLTPENAEKIRADFPRALNAKEQISLHERIFQFTRDRFVRQMYFSVFASFLDACLRVPSSLPDAKSLISAIGNGAEGEEIAGYYRGINDAINGSDDK